MDMVKQYRDVRWVIALFYLGLALLIWLFFMHEFRLDDSFITYRYARNVVRGLGLVYNPGEIVLSTTAPLYALLLAGLSHFSADYHILGGLIGSVCIGLGAGQLLYLLPRAMPLWIRGWAGLVYVLSTPLWLALGMETPLWIFLVLLAICLLFNQRYLLAGLISGCAILVRPDAALPGVLLGIVVLGTSVNAWGTRRHWWWPGSIFTVMAVLPVLVFGLWAWQTYGSPFPATLSAKSGQAILGITGFGTFVDTWGGLVLIIENLIAQSGFYIVVLILMILGTWRKINIPTLLIILWGLLHLLVYMLLGVAPYRWYYLPLLPGVILLAAYGLYRLSRLGRSAAYVSLVLAILPLTAQAASFGYIGQYFQEGGERQTMLPIVDWQAYREAGEWLNAHTPQDAIIGVAEVGQLGFYADRYMTDYLGLLQPDVAALLKQDDLYSWLVGYAPDYLVFQRFGGQVGLALYNYFIEYDPWFVANYQEVAKFDDPRYILGPVVIYERQLPVNRLLEPETVAVDFGIAQLSGIAVDLQATTVRVKLDWQNLHDLPADLHINITIGAVPGEIAFDGDYRTEHWPDSLVTWHSLILPENLTPGNYPLSVSVGNSVTGYISRPVSELKIRSP